MSRTYSYNPEESQEIAEHDQNCCTECFIQEEEKGIDEARDKMAAFLSGGDDVTFSVLRTHMDFNSGHITEHPMEREGILFYQVGRNASHEFYLGVKDGKMYRYSIGEGDYDIESGIYGLDESGVREVDAHNPGYLGHY